MLPSDCEQECMNKITIFTDTQMLIRRNCMGQILTSFFIVVGIVHGDYRLDNMIFHPLKVRWTIFQTFKATFLCFLIISHVFPLDVKIVWELYRKGIVVGIRSYTAQKLKFDKSANVCSTNVFCFLFDYSLS